MLLIALWVRSYYYGDQLRTADNDDAVVSIASMRGQWIFFSGNINKVPGAMWRNWFFRSVSAEHFDQRLTDRVFRGFELTAHSLSVPCWFPVFFSGTLAAALGIRPPLRFSLRTLLIAMTVFAVWLGFATFLARFSF
jgi:hypothetical protein